MLVLLPGLGSHAGAWDAVRAELPADLAVVALDLPGMGGRPPLKGLERTVDAYTDAVAAELAAAMGEPLVIAGNSLGGAVALELARRGVGGAACAVAPIGFWTSREARYAAMVLRVMQRTARWTRRHRVGLTGNTVTRTVLLSPVVGRPWKVAPVAAAVDAQLFADAEDVDGILPYTTRYRFTAGSELTVPVSVMWGTSDRLLIPRQSRRAERLLPHAHHVSLAGAGHVAMADAPAQIARELVALHARI